MWMLLSAVAAACVGPGFTVQDSQPWFDGLPPGATSMVMTLGRFDAMWVQTDGGEPVQVETRVSFVPDGGGFLQRLEFPPVDAERTWMLHDTLFDQMVPIEVDEAFRFEPQPVALRGVRRFKNPSCQIKFGYEAFFEDVDGVDRVEIQFSPTEDFGSFIGEPLEPLPENGRIAGFLNNRDIGFARVRSWTPEGRASEFSEPVRFGMGCGTVRAPSWWFVLLLVGIRRGRSVSRASGGLPWPTGP